MCVNTHIVKIPLFVYRIIIYFEYTNIFFLHRTICHQGNLILSVSSFSEGYIICTSSTKWDIVFITSSVDILEIIIILYGYNYKKNLHYKMMS